ncbi:effector-associated constant component EACC1 [Nocardia sp. IBHARD005]|uniref:effector-associated constant component EACC1 n=1 Tax=Nocardia sp. IBHARD005 TaxID=3457765 RepID=UPI00405A4231
MSEELVSVEVLTGSGSLLTERLTRDLVRHLAACEVEVRFAEAMEPLAHHKGAVGDALVLVVGVASSAGTATVVTTIVKEWCRRDRHRRVEMRLPDRVLVIDGNPNDQLAIIERFVETAVPVRPTSADSGSGEDQAVSS